MKKTISLLAICMIALLSLTSCLNKLKNAALENIATEANKSCPVQLSQMITMTGVKVDGDYFVYTYDVSENIASLEQLVEMCEIDREMTIVNLAQSADTKELATVLDETGKTLRYIYKGVVSGKEIIHDIQPSEILDFDKTNIASIIKKKLVKSVEQTNANCPMLVDGMTLLTSVVMNDNFFCYNYMVDEDQISIERLSDNIETMIATIHESAFDENGSMNSLVNNCKLIGYNIIYQYEGSNTGDYIKLKLNLDDETIEVVE